MNLSPEIFHRDLPKAVKKHVRRQLAQSINMMQYQQAYESGSSDEDRTFTHSKKFWKDNLAVTSTYVTQFPTECKPMKHFRNFSQNLNNDPSIKEKQQAQLIEKLLTS